MTDWETLEEHTPGPWAIPNNSSKPLTALSRESAMRRTNYTGLMAVVMMISTPVCMSMRVGFTNVAMLMQMLCP